jgi:hypothetical protein
VAVWTGAEEGPARTCVALPRVCAACAPPLSPPSPPPPQFNWDANFVDTTGVLLPLFGATMALTVGFDMIAVIICTLMLVRWAVWGWGWGVGWGDRRCLNHQAGSNRSPHAPAVALTSLSMTCPCPMQPTQPAGWPLTPLALRCPTPHYHSPTHPPPSIIKTGQKFMSDEEEAAFMVGSQLEPTTGGHVAVPRYRPRCHHLLQYSSSLGV